MRGVGMVAAEFFAGMGLMRAALDRCGIDTVFANDIDKNKASLYKENWGDGELRVCDIHDLRGCDVPNVDLATASFPCVDVSLAGYRAGLKGTRSGSVYEFCRLLDEMGEPPSIVILEKRARLPLRQRRQRLRGLGRAARAIRLLHDAHLR